jgi:hypothetical protein
MTAQSGPNTPEPKCPYCGNVVRYATQQGWDDWYDGMIHCDAERKVRGGRG